MGLGVGVGVRARVGVRVGLGSGFRFGVANLVVKLLLGGLHRVEEVDRDEDLLRVVLDRGHPLVARRGQLELGGALRTLDTHIDLEEARVVGAGDGLGQRHEHRVDELRQHARRVVLRSLDWVRVRVEVRVRARARARARAKVRVRVRVRLS